MDLVRQDVFGKTYSARCIRKGWKRGCGCRWCQIAGKSGQWQACAAFYFLSLPPLAVFVPMRKGRKGLINLNSGGAAKDFLAMISQIVRMRVMALILGQDQPLPGNDQPVCGYFRPLVM